MSTKQERLEALPALVRALVENLPLCTHCHALATRECSGGPLDWCPLASCDACALKGTCDSPHAPALRALVAGLEGL
jgi:hypothetical protein